MINYLFSQIDKENGCNEKQKEYLSKDLEGKTSIAFIASLPEEYENSDERLISYIDRFKKSGFSFSKCS